MAGEQFKFPDEVEDKNIDIVYGSKDLSQSFGWVKWYNYLQDTPITIKVTNASTGAVITTNNQSQQ